MKNGQKSHFEKISNFIYIQNIFYNLELRLYEVLVLELSETRTVLEYILTKVRKSIQNKIINGLTLIY
jgi:hypothetical protein